MNAFFECPTVNLTVNLTVKPKRNFLLGICFPKNFIWTNLKAIFSLFRLFCPLRFQIFK